MSLLLPSCMAHFKLRNKINSVITQANPVLQILRLLWDALSTVIIFWSYPMGSGSKAAGSVKPTTYLHPMPRLKMRGATPPLPQHVFRSWCLIKQEKRLHCVVRIKHRGNFTFTLPIPYLSSFSYWYTWTHY